MRWLLGIDAKKTVLSLALLLLAAIPAAAQDAPLTITGAGVKVVTIVESLPFTVNAPPGAAFYAWSYPPSIAAIDLDDKLEITSAPKGTHVFIVKAVWVDFKNEKLVKKIGRIEVNVGAAPIPPPPPPPEPDAFTKGIRDAFAIEPSPTKAAEAAALARVYRYADSKAATSATFGDLFNLMSAEAKRVGATGKLIGVQKVIQAELVRTLPTNAEAKIDGDGWDRANKAFTKIAAALEGLK